MDLSALISFCTLVSMATSRSSKPIEEGGAGERGGQRVATSRSSRPGEGEGG